MVPRSRFQVSRFAFWFGFAVLTAVTVNGQAPRSSPPPPALPQTFFSGDVPVRVVPVAKGLSHPWSLAFLPGGEMLVTERDGRLRIIRNGVLDPTPVAGVPPVFARVLGGLLDVALHPRFAENRILYLSYAKGRADNLSTTALARARFDGAALTDVKDIFVANTWSKSNTNYGGRIAFDRAGLLYLTVGERQEQDRAQNGTDHGGKVLRLRDDGSVPSDNPFVGRAGYAPEIYSLGHRSPQGLAMNPATGAMWENEHGPLGGDELNVLLPGRNYGWPLVTFGTDYDGTKISDATCARRSRSAVRVLGAVDRDIRLDLLHRRSLSAVEGQRLRRGDVRRAQPRHRSRPAHRHQRRREADQPGAAADRTAPAHSRRAGRGRTGCCIS